LLVSFSADVYETKPEIVDNLSYAVDPDGMKFKIKHEKHQYDIEQRRQYARDRVFLLYDNGSTKTSLKNGIWKLIIFTRDMNDRSQEWNTEFKLSTFFYSPIFHGAPN
jgi:hypothetical protein